MKRLLTALLAILAILAAAAATVFAVVVIGVRTRNRKFIAAFTRFQRDVINPEVLRTAGEPGDQHSVIETVGRTSGTRYETPIGARRDGDGWTVSLVYGQEASWVRNAMAAGEAVLHTDGQRRRVDGFEIVPLGDVDLPDDEATAAALFGVTHALRMRDAGDAEPAPVEELSGAGD